MATTGIDIQALARLSRIALTEAEATAVAADLQHILDHFATLQTLDLEGVPPLTQPGEGPTVLRDDVAGPALDRSEALSQAPAHDGAAFLVPKVVG